MTEQSIKQLCEMRMFKFRLRQNGRFECINQPIGLLPAELCAVCGVSVPEYTEILRAKNYDLHVAVEYRCYGYGTITIYINPLQ